MNLRFLNLSLLLIGLCTSCATRIPPPTTAPDPEGFARTLEHFIDAQGHIDFDALRAQPESLDAYVAWLAQNHPRQNTTPAATLAAYINAYNALAMYNVLHADVLPRQKVRFFLLRKLRLGDTWISLYHLENARIRPLNEPRIHFALNCMVRDCPRLLQKPWAAAQLESQLTAATREFCNNKKFVRPDTTTRSVHLSPILKWYKKDFLAEAPSLLAWINRHRTNPIPADYTIRWLDYDWSLNTPPKP